MTKLFDLKKLATDADNEVRKDLGADGIGFMQLPEGESEPLTPAIIADMFPADGHEAPYVLAGARR